jgi:hypothetical protein
MKRRFIVATLAPLVITTSHSLAQSKLSFDRAWWDQLHSKEQSAFIFGYLDCRQLPRTPNVPAEKYQEFIASRKTSGPRAIPTDIECATHKLKSTPIERGAETWPEPHGWLDGAYWGTGQVQPGWRDTQRGFVEGYLACAKSDATTADVAYFVRKIDLHYLDPNKEHDKIANVLNPLLAEKKNR